MHPCLEAELIYRVPLALLSPRTRFHPTLGGDPALCQGLSPQMGLDPKLFHKNILEMPWKCHKECIQTYLKFHMLHVTCHLLHVTCHMSHVTCYMTHFILDIHMSLEMT